MSALSPWLAYDDVPALRWGVSAIGLFGAVGITWCWLQREEWRISKVVAQEQLRSLELENISLRALAHEDPLTGLANRRGLLQQLERLHAQAVREDQVLSVLMLDIDHFKQVNDSYGHAAGDLVLKRMAGVLKEQCRGMDVLCRWGGEEFLVVMPHCGTDAAWRAAEKVRLCVEQSSSQWLASGDSLTVSIGVAAALASDLDHAAQLQQADDALYQAKREGRNRVCCCGKHVPRAPRQGDAGLLVWDQKAGR